MSLEGTLREHFGDAAPADALWLQGSREGEGLLAWQAPNHPMPVSAVACVRPDMMPSLSLFDGGPGEIGNDHLDYLCDRILHPSPRVRMLACLHDWGDPGTAMDRDRARAASLGLPESVRATAYMVERGLRAWDVSWEWLADPTLGGRAAAFCDMHPWLALECPGLAGMAATVEAGDFGDAAWRTAMHAARLDGDSPGHPDPEGAARALATGLRHFRVPSDGHHAPGGITLLRCVLAMPREAWPAPIPAGSPAGSPERAEMAAFYMASDIVALLARATGRPARSVTGRRTSGWAAYVEGLHRRSGLPPVAGHGPDDAASRALSVATLLRDMGVAYWNQVVAPLLLSEGRTGVTIATPHPPSSPPFRHWDPSDPPAPGTEMALGMLLGRKSLPALCEACRDWHRASAGIEAFLAGLHGPGTASGPDLFPDTDLGRDILATCLRTPASLLAEGGHGPDSHGVDGLDHCVGGYADRVLAGRTSVVSLRRRLPGGGHERLSTVEVDFKVGEAPVVVQHFGRRNAPPPAESAEALPRLLAAVGEGASRAIMEHVPVEVPSIGRAIHEAGAWDAVRDLWSFALTRPQRAMGPAEFLDHATASLAPSARESMAAGRTVAPGGCPALGVA